MERKTAHGETYVDMPVAEWLVLFLLMCAIGASIMLPLGYWMIQTLAYGF